MNWLQRVMKQCEREYASWPAWKKAAYKDFLKQEPNPYLVEGLK